MEATDIGSDVDIHDVAFFHDRVIRDAVANDFIQRGATRFRVSAVTQG